MQIDALAIYKSQRNSSRDYSLDNLDFDTMEAVRQQQDKVKYNQDTDTFDIVVGQFDAPNRMGIAYTEEALRGAYAVYNIQAMRLEEVIYAQRQLDKLIAKKRKKDPNYNVTVLRRDGSMP